MSDQEQEQRKVVTKLQIVIFDDGNIGMHAEGRQAPADMLAAERYLTLKTQRAYDRMEMAEAMKRRPLVAPVAAMPDLSKKVG